MNKIILASSLVAIASTTIATPAHALINIIGTETGGNVQFSYSGSLNVTGLTPETITFLAGAAPNSGGLLFTGGTSNRGFNGSLTGPSFGSGGFVFASSISGDPFAIIGSGNGRLLLLPNNYVSGTNISGSVTFNSRTFASLGVTPGTYNYNLTNGLDSVALNINATPVPFEFSPALGLGVLGSLVVAKKLSRKLLKK